MGRKITIMGMGASGSERRHDIMQYVSGTEVWGLNNGYLKYPVLKGRWDRFFELHNYKYLTTWKSGVECHFSALNGLGCPVYVGQNLPIIENQVRYDFAEVFDHHNCNYFLGSPSLMVAYALYEHDKGQTIDEIRSWGIDTNDPTHRQQRHSWAWWLSQAHARGIAFSGTAIDFFQEPDGDEGLKGLREMIGGQIQRRRQAKYEEPVIVGGLLHSGTSHVAKCLSAAGVDMHYLGVNDNEECMEMMRIMQREYQRQGIIVANFDDMLADGAPFPKPTQELIDDLEQYKAQREKSKPWGFKHPSVSVFPEAFKQVFPEAKYVLCVRDYKNQSESRVRRGFVSSEEAGAAAYNRRKAWAKDVDLRWIEYDYDGDPQEESRKLSDALGMNVDVHTTYKRKVRS